MVAPGDRRVEAAVESVLGELEMISLFKMSKGKQFVHLLKVLCVQVSQCVVQRWIVDTLHPHLQDRCDHVVLVSTSILCTVVRHVRSPSFLDQLVVALLQTPSLMDLLLQHCDHASAQISVASLCLVDELLQKPHRDILDLLVFRFLQCRSYLSSPVGRPEEHLPDSSSDSEDPEDDPFFSDSLSEPSLHPPEALGSSVGGVNSFLCLVPVQVRSAHLLQEGGYESYVHDARALVSRCQALSEPWEWPKSPPAASPSAQDAPFFEGPLLRVLLDRLGRILEQPYELNLQLTAVLSRLAAFRHPVLDEYLLDPYIDLSQSCRSLFSVLVRVVSDLMQRIQQISNLSESLLVIRRRILDPNLEPRLEEPVLLRGIIILEEFCKELAAISFVKMEPEEPVWAESHLD